MKLEQQRHEEMEKQRLEQQLIMLRNKEKGKESMYLSINPSIIYTTKDLQ